MSNSGRLLAGSGIADITPPYGTQLGGDIGRWRPAEVVLDPLKVRCTVFEEAGRRACLIVLDVIAIRDDQVAIIRNMLAECFGFAPEAIMLHATQTHSGPSLGHLACSDQCDLIPPQYSWLRSGDEAYNEFVREPIANCVEMALGNLAPVNLHLGTGVEGRCAWNRRFVMRDGSVRCHPQGADLVNILHCEGPIDPEVGVANFVGEDLSLRSAILHFTCHPTHGYPHRWVSADWPAAWINGYREAVGGNDGYPMVLNGFCGNIHHNNHLVPSQEDTIERMGRLLTETSVQIARSLRRAEAVPLKWESRRVAVPLRKSAPEDLEQARIMIEKNPEPLWLDEQHTAVNWDWLYAVSILDLADRVAQNPVEELEVQVIRLGELALVGVGGEPFVEGQLQIKIQSPVRHTFVGHMCNGFGGYMPTPQAVAGGGYESRAANWSRVDGSALGILADEAEKMLNELFAE